MRLPIHLEFGDRYVKNGRNDLRPSLVVADSPKQSGLSRLPVFRAHVPNQRFGCPGTLCVITGIEPVLTIE